MFGILIAPAIGAAIASGIGALGASAINAASQARTNAMNRKQAEDAFRKEQDAIREQNFYNSPSQQVVRMKSAGLNPSLAYGADGQMVGNQSEVPAYNAIPAEAPQVQSLGIAEAAQTMLNFEDLKRKQDLAVAEIAAKDYQNFLALTQGELNQAQQKETLELLGFKMENYESITQLNWEKVLETRQNISRIRDEQKVLRKQVELTDAQIAELAERAGMEQAEAIAILAKLPHEIMNMDAQTAYSYAASAQCRETIKNLATERMHLHIVEELEQQKLDWEKDKTQIEAIIRGKEMQAHELELLQQGIMNIIGLAVGGAAMRRGDPLPPKVVSRSAPTHHGVGSSRYPAQVPKTNHAGLPIGSR